MWTSVDGLTWSYENLGGILVIVAAGGPGLVAVGSGVWTSVDGIVWSRVPHDLAVFGTDGPGSVTVGGPGLVAVGTFRNEAAVWVAATED